jgi:ribosomal protein S16
LTEELFKALSYEAETGIFRWREPLRRGMKPGSIAGTNTNTGYVSVSVHGKSYLAHRLAWFMSFGSWPAHTIDHVNGDGRDNRLSNLRHATPSQNSMNRGAPITNTSGVRGVSLVTRTGRWEASIVKDGKKKRFGSYLNFEDAVAARQCAELEEFGEFSPLATAVETMAKKVKLVKRDASATTSKGCAE